jgi:hypothetical protein
MRAFPPGTFRIYIIRMGGSNATIAQGTALA